MQSNAVEAVPSFCFSQSKNMPQISLIRYVGHSVLDTVISLTVWPSTSHTNILSLCLPNVSHGWKKGGKEKHVWWSPLLGVGGEIKMYQQDKSIFHCYNSSVFSDSQVDSDPWCFVPLVHLLLVASLFNWTGCFRSIWVVWGLKL